MSLTAYTDFLDYWVLTGAGSPLADKVTGGRALTLTSGATPPRTASYSRRRGAEFRTSAFAASEPTVFKTPGTDGLNTSLYVSSKIQSFTWVQRFRPQRTGVTSVALCPIGGLFSVTNYGSPGGLYNQPCFMACPQVSGSSKLLVFVGDKVFDTEYATQTEGPTSTTPISDEGWNTVAVSVEGDPSNNNKILSVTVFTENSSGVRRTYTLGARKAAARFNWSGQPSDGDTIVIDGQTHTFKTSLGGTDSTSTILGDGTNPSPGETVTINGVVYTFVTSLTPTYATGVIEVNCANAFKDEVSKGEVYIRVGGYVFYLLWGTEHVRGMSGGYLDGVGNDTTNQGQYLVDYLNGVYNGNGDRFQNPTTPNLTAAGEYVSDNGQAWGSPSRTINWTVTGPVSSGAVREVTVTAAAYGALQIPIVVIDGWKNGPGGSQTGKPTNWRVRVKSGTVDNTGLWSTYDDGNGKTQGVTKGGTAAPAAYSVKIESGWTSGGAHSGTRGNLIAAILKNGTEGTDYYGVAAANSVVKSAAASGANDILLTSALAGTAGNGKVVSDTSSHLTTANFAGGADGATDPRWIKIGATAALSWANLVACLNHTGTPGTDYGNASSAAHATVAGEAGTSYFIARARTAGSAGNSIAVSEVCASLTSIKDEFNDVAATTLLGGCAAGAWTVAAGSRPDNADLRVYVGGLHASPNGTAGKFFGVVSDCALSNKVWTSDEFAEFCATPPPTSTRDRGWYRAAARMSYQARTESMSNWRTRTNMPTGNLTPTVPITLHGSRCSFKFWGVEAGRPFAISNLAVDNYKRGGIQGPRRYVYTFPGFSSGIDKSASRESISPAAMADMLNMSGHHKKPRRRRGYRMLTNDASGSASYPMAFFDATTATGEVYHLVYRNGSIYSYDNGVMTELDTGWPSNEIPTFATIGEKTFIATSARTRVFKGGSLFAPGVAAPTSGPTLVSITPTANGVIVTKPGWEYMLTYYDGTHETDSGPSATLKVLRVDGTEPATVRISLPASADVPSGVTKIKVWKRRLNADTFFLVDEVTDWSSGYYDDAVDQPSSIPLESFNGVDVTAEWPDITAVGEHEGRLVGWRGTDKRVLLYSEVGDGERWFPLNSYLAKAEIRMCLSHEGRHFILTDRTVEVNDGDFIRGSSGALAISHKVLDTSKGVFGPFAGAVGRGRLFWVDPVGIHVMGQGTDQKDVTRTISWPVHPYVQNAIDTEGTTVVVDFNHVSQDMWVCITQANQTSDNKVRITLVYNLETGEWSVFDHPLSWVCRVNDGLFGQQFYGCDYYNNLLELDVYDGDGCEGNESWHPGAGVAITSISGTTINFTGTSLPTTLRGVSAVFEDLSSLDAPFYRATILSSTPTSIVVDKVPSAIAAGDKVHIGGIIGMMETAEVDLGTPENKTWHYAAVGLSDLTRADY